MGPRSTVVGAAAGGALVGLAGLSPDCWALAWLGVATLAFALARASGWRSVLAGLAAGCVLQRLLWQRWSFGMAEAMAPDHTWIAGLLPWGFLLLTGLPTAALLVLAALGGLGPRRLPLGLGLPLAWTLGERVQARWTSVATDWLFTQVDVAPVMGALSRLGLVPTTLICLGLAAGAGEAAARGRWRLLGGLTLGMGALVFCPPPARVQDELLEGVAVVHAPSELELPSLDGMDPAPDLVIWPEDALARSAALAEGPLEGEALDVLLGGEDTQHLVGLLSPAMAPVSHNLVALLSAEGNAQAARAKQTLFPPFERSLLGIGTDRFQPGSGVAVLPAPGRALIPLICGELLDRTLVSRGVQAGGTLLTVSARDHYQGGSAQAAWQVLAHLRLRAIEFRVPAVYASLEGQAAIVATDGEVLAQSARGAPAGLLTWNRQTGARDHTSAARPEVVVLYAPETPHLRPDCPPGRCRTLSLDEALPSDLTAPTVILTGHGDGRAVGGVTAEALAERVAALRPELVVLDACLSASTPLLAAIARRSDALLVASTERIRTEGFRYDPPFFSDEPVERRARAVVRWPPAPLYVGRPDPGALAALEAQVEATPGTELQTRVRSWDPTLVSASLGDGQELLVPADWRRIGQPRPPAEVDAPARFELSTLWFDRPGAEARAQLDLFLDCLIHGSDLLDFFEGEASVSIAGSWVVPAPAGPTDVRNREHWVEDLVANLPTPAEGVVPVYLFLGPAADLPLHSACGYHEVASVNGRRAGLLLVRTSPPCWPGDTLRTATQISMHELAEGLDELLGNMGCVADGRCEGGGGCPAPCENFTGLWCPGAPEQSFVGCDGRTVRGWVIQRLAHKGQETPDCEPCAACDFTVRQD